MSTASQPRREDLPDGSVRIWFAAPILHFAEPKGSLLLRPPTAGEVWELGDPRGYIEDTTGGLGTDYIDRPLLVQWIKRLMSEHDCDVIGRERDASLGLLIQQAVLDFFTKARLRLRPESALSPKPE